MDELHLHEHEHDGVQHRHAHFHDSVSDENHEHARHGHTHAYAFELYSYADSPIHRLDARTKTISIFALIIIMALTPVTELWRFELFAVLLLALYIVAKVPILYGIKRSFIVIPFVLFAGMFLILMPDRPHPGTFYNTGFSMIPIKHGGIYILVNALLKSMLSVMSVVLLYSTTPFPRFLKGLELMRVPHILTTLFSFLYRFMWILTEEVKRMMRARDARAFGGSRIWHLKVAGQMVGSLFIRSYERAERVFAAMQSRGYDGTIKTLDVEILAMRDVIFSVLFAATLLTIILWR